MVVGITAHKVYVSDVTSSVGFCHIRHFIDIFQHPVTSCHYYIHAIPYILPQVSSVDSTNTELRSPKLVGLPSDGNLVRGSFSRIPWVSPNGTRIGKTGRGVPKVSFGIFHAVENGIFLECSLKIIVYIQKIAGTEQQRTADHGSQKYFNSIFHKFFNVMWLES